MCSHSVRHARSDRRSGRPIYPTRHCGALTGRVPSLPVPTRLGLDKVVDDASATSQSCFGYAVWDSWSPSCDLDGSAPGFTKKRRNGRVSMISFRVECVALWWSPDTCLAHVAFPELPSFLCLLADCSVSIGRSQRALVDGRPQRCCKESELVRLK